MFQREKKKKIKKITIAIYSSCDFVLLLSNTYLVHPKILVLLYLLD